MGRTWGRTDLSPVIGYGSFAMRTAIIYADSLSC